MSIHQHTIQKLSTDRDFINRLTIAAYQKGEKYPESWVMANVLNCITSSPESVVKYQEIFANPYRDTPGLDPKVITDEEVLYMVEQAQSKLAENEEEY